MKNVIDIRVVYKVILRHGHQVIAVDGVPTIQKQVSDDNGNLLWVDVDVVYMDSEGRQYEFGKDEAVSVGDYIGSTIQRPSMG